jgi:hypothetical protein
MTKPPRSQADPALFDLDAMLALAERELAFLRDHFGGRRDFAVSASGAEFLETIDIARLALARARFERSESGSASEADRAVQDAIVAMAKQKP